jgi:hypothetical protein
MIIICTSSAYSQKISAGIYSGMNFSDLHGQDIGGKWNHKPGPSEGLYIGYSFNKSLGVQTGVNFSTVYYSHKTPYYQPVYYDLIYSLYPRLEYPYSYPGNSNLDFRFIRIPLQLTISVPDILQFEMRAGIYFSFLNDYDVDYLNYYDISNKPAKHDFGYVFSSGISYPLSNKFKATFNAGYFTGRKEFLENFNYRHGSSEFTLGVAYTGFNKNKIKNVPLKNNSDSLSNAVIITVRGGVNYSWKKGRETNGDYNSATGPSFGFSVKVPISSGAFFQTGFSFERKGYSIGDSSTSFYRLIKDESQMYYVDTKVQADYAVIPALLTFQLGKPGRLYFSTGPWLGLKLNARTVGVAYNEYHSGTSYQLKRTVVYDDLEKLIKNYDTGWIFGFEVSIPVIKNYDVDVALQYSTGFRNVFDRNQLGQSDPNLIIRNRTVSLILGFKIPTTDH